MTIGRNPDRLFAHITAQLSGDYVVLSRYADDDYIRPADMRTNCQRLNTASAQPDDLSEPNRFEHGNTTLTTQGWKLDDGGYVRTSYACYPTGEDFTAAARLRVNNIPESSATPTPPYMIEGIAFTYGCCFGIGLGYARWNPNNYRRVIFAYSPDELKIQGHNESTYLAEIRRTGGNLILGNWLNCGLYKIPERMAVRRVRIEVV